MITSDEFETRAVARVQLDEYKGNIFDAVRQDDENLLNSFFVVHGSDWVLNIRNTHQDEGNRTVLHTAAFWGSIKCTEVLLVRGARVNVSDTVYCHVSPLLEAARAGHALVCNALLGKGADVGWQDANGDTCFHWCARKGNGALLNNLILIADKCRLGSASSGLGIKNNRGKTCLDIAKNETVAELIRRNATKVSNEKRLLLHKFKKGLGKAKIVGKNLESAKVLRNKHKRYGE